jgi:hypothetical protein
MRVVMPAIFDLLYREYCRARLAEMRKQLLLMPQRNMPSKELGDDASPTREANTVASDVSHLRVDRTRLQALNFRL